MKKTTKNITDQNSTLDPLSGNNGSNPLIDGNDEFVLFPLDVQETNTITQNNATSQDDDFILFPLDINKSVTSSNNSGPIINKVPKKQFVTKPNPRPIIKPQPAPGPITPKPIVTSPKNNKLRNLFWLIVICLSIYTCKNKENDESYSRFFNKTIHKLGKKINKVKSIFVNENDFKEFKKSKQIIYSPYLEYLEDDSGEINEVKGDSIIIIEPTGKFRRAYYLPKGKPFKLKITKDEFTKSERYANEKMELDIDQSSFENQSEYSDRVSVFLLNTGLFSQEISVYRSDIRFEDSNDIEVKYMRNRIEDFKKNTILTKFISKSLLDKKANIVINSVNKTNNKIVKTNRELRHLFFSNGGLIAYYNDGTTVACERCELNKNNLEMMFKIKPVENYSNDEILNEIKENGKEGWALVDYKWILKVPNDFYNEIPSYPNNYSNIITEIITNYYDDLNNNNFNAENYYAKNVEQFISIKNTNPNNINSLINDNDYQDGVSTIDESSIKLIDSDSNNYYSCWSFNLNYQCFRPSKGKYQKCNITIYLGFDENNHIVSYKEKKIRNLKFYD
jgi:hypothetical protein